MKILVTGADGFVGLHLCNHLRACGDDVVAVGGPTAKAGLTPLDIRRHTDVLALFAETRPEFVVHLAGSASVGASFADPVQTFEVNALGTTYVLEAARQHCPKARVLLISSGEVYGAGDESFSELSPVAPMSPYAASKLAAELQGKQFAASYGLDVVISRSFNQTGPGQDPRFVIPAIAEQLRAIRESKAEPRILIGNLDPVRDFSSVLDTVEAYRLLLLRGASGEIYNVCSGRPLSVRDIVTQLVQASGVAVELVVDPTRVRANDAARLVGNPAKINALGWRATRDPLFGVA